MIYVQHKIEVLFLILAALIGCGGSPTVRSDVAKYISTQYPANSRLQKALETRALIYQEAQNSPDKLKTLRPKLERTLRCIRYLEPLKAKEINRDFLKNFFNSAELIKLYAKLNQKLAGGDYAYKVESSYDCDD
jgi:hypothetical protein